MSKDIVLYSSDFRKKHTLYKIIKDTYTEIKKYKYQIILAVKKDIRTTYQQDTFSLFWVVIMPIIPMTVYMLLAHVKIFNSVESIPFVFFIAIGMFIWLLMASIIRSVMLSIKKDKGILRTTEFPIIASMLSQLGKVLHESFIRLFAVIVIMLWYQIDSSIISLVIATLSLIPIIIISFSIGVIVALLDVIMQDTRRIVDIFLRYGLFISSVIFPFPTEGILGTINNFNFFNTYVVWIRDLVYFGTFNNLDIFIYTSLVGIGLFFIAIKLLYALEYKVRAFL